MTSLDKIISTIQAGSRILLLTHENPDGDGLGSILSLREVLSLLGKKADCVCVDPVSQPFGFLPFAKEIKKDFLLGDYDLIVILDCGDLRRTGFSHRLKELSRYKRKIINIDHHPKNDLHRISRLNLIDYQASSTSEILFRLFREMRIEINSKIATALLCGLYTDTGAFQHSNTSPEVLKIASELLKKGARLKEITRNITNGKSVAALRLWGIVLSRVQKNKRLGLVTSVITQKDLASCQASRVDLAGAVNFINSIPETRAAILFYELGDGRIKASLRTEKNDVDVSSLARIFGGGGLKKASGFTIEGKIVKNRTGWKII